MSETIQNQMDEIMNAAHTNQWVEQFNRICKSSYIDLNDDESVNRIFLVPDEAVRLDDITVRPDYTRHAYALSHKTNPRFSAEQRAQEIFAGLQNNCSIYIAAPGSTQYRKITLDKDRMPILGEEIQQPGDAPTPPTKPSGWKRFANWLTRGSAYKADFQQYDTDMENYRNALADHMEKVEEFARVDAINGKSVGRNHKAEGEYKQKVDTENQRIWLTRSANNSKTQIDTIQNSYKYFFAPNMDNVSNVIYPHGTDPEKLDDMRRNTYNVPSGVTVQQATALAFAASISAEAMSGIEMPRAGLRSLRSFMVENYLSKPEDRTARVKALDDAVIKGREMTPGLMAQISEGNLAPAAEILTSAITGILENRVASGKMSGGFIQSVGTPLEGLKNCLNIPGMRAAVRKAGLTDRDMQHMDVVIGLRNLDEQNVYNVDRLLTTDYYLPEEAGIRNEALQQALAFKLMQGEFMDGITEALEQTGDSVNREFIPIEVMASRDIGLLMHTYTEKAKETDFYKKLSRVTDPYVFREEALMMASGIYRHQDLSRTSISADELSGRQPQRVSMNRTVQQSVTMDLTSSKK